jgi:photosystem II stability/assembly factor-like uncharacterized protein
MDFMVAERWDKWWLAVMLILIVLGGSPAGTYGQERWYTIQIASVVSEEEARGLLSLLRTRGIAAYAVRAEVKGLGLRYRIRYGRFRTPVLARSEAEREIGRGSYKDFIISREEPEAITRKIVIALPGSIAEKRKEPAPVPSPQSAETTPIAAERRAPSSPVVAMPVTKPTLVKTTERKGPPRVIPPIPELISSRNRWEAIVPDSLPDERWTAIQFIDGLTGWIGGENGSLYRTNDGGRTWREVAIEGAGRIVVINFTDWNSGWVLVERVGSADLTGRRLLMTRNGGRSWRLQPLPGSERLVRIDGRRGWALGRGGWLWRTVDGGESWTRGEKPFSTTELDRMEMVDLTTNSGEKRIEVEQTGAGTLWMITNQEMGAADLRLGGVWRSEDGGESWSTVKIPLELASRQGRFLSIRFQDRVSGIITGETTNGEGRSWFILTTTDGGKIWKLEVQPGRELAQARFTDGNDIERTLIGGSRGSLKIGHGWTQTATIEADKTGSSSHIETHLLVTLNGGQTWTEEFRLIGRHTLMSSFIREDQGWVMTERGVLLIGRPN